MQLRFSKMHGLGNDFVVIDALNQNAKLNAEQIRRLADRRLGVGCDQLLLIEAPHTPDTDFHYRIFNGDGNEVEQCGNGARCFGLYISEKRLSGKRKLKVSTSSGHIQIEVLDRHRVSVDMGAPRLNPADIPFIAPEQQTVYPIDHELGCSDISAVSMGNPHAVMLVDAVAAAAVDSLGPVLEVHERFPNRVNVGFMEVCSRTSIKVRVFERGVGETSACGTGACAAVVAGQLRGLLDHEVEVALTGGNLHIQWQGGTSSVTMTGTATHVYDGKITV